TARNILSGNGGNGFAAAGFLQADTMTVTNNYVGVATDGITAHGNNGNGLSIVARVYTVAQNIVAANTNDGITIATGTGPSVIRNNRIGVALDGSALGNGRHGINVTSGNGLVIGGPLTDQNLIANNTGAGIRVSGSAQTEIAENSITANGGLGIDLGTLNAVDANDALDADTQNGNNMQNRPQLASAASGGGLTAVNVSLGSAASSTYTLRFYTSPVADPSGFGEGQTYIGAMQVTTNASGTASATFNTPSAPSGSYVTCTATAANGDTSEFSNAVLVSSPGQLQFSTASYATPESSNITLTIQRVGGTTGAVSASWTTSAGTATSPADFAASSGTVNFADGQTSQTFSIPIAPDPLDEANESFTVTLSNPTGGASLGTPSTATVTINDDDPSPALTIAGDARNEGNTGTSPLTFVVTLSPASGQVVNVDYVTNAGTATAGSDFTAIAGTLTFAPGEITKSIAVPIIGDTAIETNESFTMTLSNPSNASITTATATGTINNDDGAPSITIGDVAIIEGNSGTSIATFPLTLSGPTTSTVTVNWSTADGSATASTDYQSNSGIATFAPGSTTATIAITINGDAVPESNETFFVDLAGPSNATLGDSQGGGTIADDDGTPSLSINDPAIVEGMPAVFTVTLAPASSLPVTVAWSSTDPTNASGTLTFAAGETTKPISIATASDTIAEPSETFTVTLASPSGATIGDATGIATIIDDDGAPRVTIGNASSSEGNALTFTVDLSHASASTINVTWQTVDGTATDGVDYTGLSGTLTFLAGELTKTITIATTSDALVEPDETFFVHLSSATNATITDDDGAGTILNDDGFVSASIDDVTAAESATFTFDVTLSAASSQPVTVQYATANDTAIAGSDYTAAAGNLTFAAGETSKPITIAVANDALFETSETFFINLLAASNATIADGQATGTILDDDTAPVVPAISIAPASVVEGNAGSASLSFDVTLSAATTNGVTVSYATTDGTASNGADYVSTTGTLTFAPGTTSRTIVVPIVGDTLVEGNETLTVTLASPSNGTLGTSSATGTIVDDDIAPVIPTISIGAATLTEGDNGNAPMTFAVTLSAPTTNTVTVTYTTADDTAIAGNDYAATTGTLVFAPGMTSLPIAIAVNGDTLVEGNETFTVTLTNPSNATLAIASASGTILDNDIAPVVPAVSIASASTTEGDNGSTPMTFVVTLSAATTNTVTINYTTADDTASAGVDYATTSGTLVFAPGTLSQSILVPVLGDTLVEGNETFTVTLTNPSNATLAIASASGTILDNDTAPLVPAISIASASTTEGNSGSTPMTFVITLSAATTNAVTANYLTTGNTATAGTDYATTSGTLTFAPGTTSLAITVPIIGDTLVESTETFGVTLSAPNNATLGTASATGTILDDDSLPFVPAISIGDISQLEGNSGATLFNFPVTLNGAATATVSAHWTTASGTAASSSDFIATSGTLVFAPGMTSQTIAIAINGDTLVERDESFTITLSAPANATLANAIATGTIRNDDRNSAPTPSLTASSVSVQEGHDAIVTLTLSSSAPGASIRWMTHTGTASSNDYTESAGNVTFGANTTATITIPTTADTTDEEDETFTLQLFDADGITATNDHAIITIVDDDDARASRGIVLAVGSLQGAAGSRFGTAMQLVNLSDAPATGELRIHPAATNDTAGDATIPYALAPRELRAYGDLLAEHGLQGLATLDVIPATGALPRMTVRIYDDGSGHGRTGFTLPVVTPDDALVAGDTAILIAPDNPIAMRFNVGIRTLDAGATIEIEVRDRLGNSRHMLTRQFAPQWFNQLPGSDFAGIALQGGDYLVLHIRNGSAILYGAAVDNITNDPSVEVVKK
ncbi:MAG: beta strand repeat-containing protein, partial [Thermoanaerobaculia bacterium]